MSTTLIPPANLPNVDQSRGSLGWIGDRYSEYAAHPLLAVGAAQSLRMNKSLVLEAMNGNPEARRIVEQELTPSGAVRPKTYTDVLRKGEPRMLHPWARKLTAEKHLLAAEEVLYRSNPTFWNLIDIATVGRVVGSRVAKSMYADLSRNYFGPTYQGDQTLADLAKAMATQNIGGGYGDDTPLRLQNLDATMTSVLYEAQHLVKWNWLERVPSIQPLYEWVDRLSYGDDRGSSAFMEGGTPAGGTASFSRNQIYVRWFGVRRGITHQMALTGQLGGAMVDPVKEENRDGALQLLARIERNFIWGDHTITDNYGNTVNYDGIVLALQNGTQYVGTTQSNPVPNYYTPGLNIVDMYGAPPNFQMFEEVGRLLAERGFLTDFRNIRAFMDPAVLEDLAAIKFVEEFKPLLQEPYRGFYSGAPLAGHQTNYGFIPFTYDIFLKRAGLTDQPPTTPSSLAPAPPMAPGTGSSSTLTLVNAGSTGAPATSKFLQNNPYSETGLGTDWTTYYYWVTAANDAGESQYVSFGSVAVQGSTTVPNPVVQINIEAGNSNGQPVTKYYIYRGLVNNPYDSRTGCIGVVAAANLGASNSVTTFYDSNEWRPQLGKVFILERTPTNLAIAQMLPMLKWPLAIVSTTVEWLVLLYHVLVVKAPQRQFLIKNIGRLNRRGLPGGVANII